MTKERLAIIGSGIAGLGCLYALQDDFEVTVFEQNATLGGHTHTVTVQEEGREIAMDTGFMVFNPVTYPNLTYLFQQLGIATQPTEMSFSLRHDDVRLMGDALEWSGAAIHRLFSQRRNLLSPRFWRFLLEIQRFANLLPTSLNDPRIATWTLQEYLEFHGFNDDFLTWFLLPMSSAIWSTAGGALHAFPIQTLLRFFDNHNFLGTSGQHQWYTVTGGASTYVDRIRRNARATVRCNSPIQQVRCLNSDEENAPGVCITTVNGESYLFSRVILACHADQSLKLLATPTELEQRLLSPFHYQRNHAWVHQDTRWLPRRKRAWSAWNYHVSVHPDGSQHAATHYWMNCLQKLPTQQPYFVGINPPPDLDERLVHHQLVYEHPVFSVAAIHAQRDLPTLNQQKTASGTEHPIYFCGSYFRYGFHEDALLSAWQLCEQLLKRPNSLLQSAG